MKHLIAAALFVWSTATLAAEGYSAGILALTPAALATDIFTVTGSATKTVRVVEISLQCTETTAGTVAVQLVKRSTADTGGTSTAPAAVPHDSASAAATATVLAYTANPTTGTLVGVVRATRENWLAAATAANAPRNPFTLYQGLPIVLRGTAQVLAVSLNGATVAGGNCALWSSWTEE
jgi:hypothetical protein